MIPVVKFAMCLSFMDEVFGFQAGILEEMLDDTMETLDDDELEEEADSEVEKVLYELTAGKIKASQYMSWKFVRGKLSLDLQRKVLYKNTATEKELYLN